MSDTSPISPISDDLRAEVILELGPAHTYSCDIPEYLALEAPNEGKRARSWFFTWWTPPESQGSHLSHAFDLKKAKYMFQLEMGPRCGRLHYQGVVQFKNQIALKQLKKIDRRIKWMIVISLQGSINYCCKLETRVNGPWYSGFRPPMTPEEQYGIFTELLPWQAELKAELMGPVDPRKVIWFYDEGGNKGKSSFAKYMQVTTNFTSTLSGKGDDMLHILSKDVAKKDITVVIFTFTRTVENYVSYQTIEQIKDGFCISGKYDSCRLIMKAPHVVCMANFLPDRTKLSADRWDIRTLDAATAFPAGPPTAVE